MPIPSGASTAARAAATASAGSRMTLLRFGFGRISAMTVSFTVIGCEAPERPALLGMPPISSISRSRSIAAAARPSFVSSRVSSPPRVRPPSTARP